MSLRSAILTLGLLIAGASAGAALAAAGGRPAANLVPVAGRLEAIGGPPFAGGCGPSCRDLSGTVRFAPAGHKGRVHEATAHHGKWATALPPGRYVVSATSPQMGVASRCLHVGVTSGHPLEHLVVTFQLP